MSPLDSPQMFSFVAEIHNQRVYRQKVPKCFHDILACSFDLKLSDQNRPLSDCARVLPLAGINWF
jgi:hypothetical protein